MEFRALRYLFLLSAPLSVYVSLTNSGVWTFLPLIYAFVIIPVLELVLGSDSRNFSESQEKEAFGQRAFDWVLYLSVPVYFLLFLFFFQAIAEEGISTAMKVGRTTGMGLLCGLIGINVAHELGHRTNRVESLLAKTLLWSTQYLHFHIEHNEGHHRNVSTPEDPATARLGESLYAFWVRSVVNSYHSAWDIETKRLKRKKMKFISWGNRMLIYTLLQLLALVLVGWVFGWEVLFWYSLAAGFGILLLETINYIEHYGLARIKVSEHRYENTGPQHSWNSDHVVGRLMLYELSRHSDHHFDPSRPYQVLRHHDESPEMPTGYPGMMVLAAIPPLWFAVMHPRIAKLAPSKSE